MKVLSVCTNSSPGLYNFRTSLSKNGFEDVEIMGQGEKWGGWRYRMRKYLNRCAELEPTEVVIHSDGDDVLCVKGDSKTMEDTYRTFGTSIVTAAESICGSNCVPLHNYWKDQKRPSCQYVNCGVLIGEAQAFVKLWTWVLEQGYEDDQVGLANYINAFPEEFSLDDQHLLFYVNPTPVLKQQPEYVKDPKSGVMRVVFNDEESYEPFFLHFAGNFVHASVENSFIPEALQQHQSHYNHVAKTLLGSEGLEKAPHEFGITISRIIFWGILTILTVFCFVLGWFLYRTYMKLTVAESKLLQLNVPPLRA